MTSVIEAFLSRAVLVAIRVGGLMTFAPFFGNAALPNQVKAGLTFVLTALLLPGIRAGNAGPLRRTHRRWIADGAERSGRRVDGGIYHAVRIRRHGTRRTDRRLSIRLFARERDRSEYTGAKSRFWRSSTNLSRCSIFMELGMHRWLLRAMAVSFRLIPIGGLAGSSISPRATCCAWPAAMWLIGAEIAFPVLLATMLIDLTIGFVTKASPQFPAMFLGISVKVSCWDLRCCTVRWRSGRDPRTHYFYHALTDLERLLAIAR